METQKTLNSQSNLEKEKQSQKNPAPWFQTILCVCVSVTQLCSTLCDPMDCNPPGSSVHGILQARILEWVAIPFSRGSSWPRDHTILHSYKVIKTVWYCHRTRNIDQWNRTENPEINSHSCSQSTIDKGGKNIQWRKDNLFNKWCWENWIAACKRTQMEHILTPCTKVNLKWIRNLSLWLGLRNLLEENRQNTLWNKS